MYKWSCSIFTHSKKLCIILSKRKNLWYSLSCSFYGNLLRHKNCLNFSLSWRFYGHQLNLFSFFIQYCQAQLMTQRTASAVGWVFMKIKDVCSYESSQNMFRILPYPWWESNRKQEVKKSKKKIPEFNLAIDLDSPSYHLLC